MEVYIFRKDKWHQICLPVDVEGWTEDEKQMYGCLNLSFQEKGFSKQYAEQLAEAFVFQQKYRGLRYSSNFERDLCCISGK